MKIPLPFTIVICVHLLIGGILLVQPGCASDEEAKNNPVNKTSAIEKDPSSSFNDPTVEEVENSKEQIAVIEGTDSLRAAPQEMAWNASSSKNKTIIVEEKQEKITLEPKTIDATNETQEEIIAPKEEQKFITYKIQRGDSLWKIAKAYNVSVAQIKAANNLSSDILNYGFELKIPTDKDDTKNIKTLEETATVSPAAETQNTYKVARGDSLSKIANKFNVSLSQLKKENGLSSDMIMLDQVLKIPSSSAPKLSSNTAAITPVLADGKNVHIVKSGEYLGYIASKNKTTVAILMSLNNIKDPRTIQIGQKIILPSSAKVETPAPATTAPAAKVEIPAPVAPTANNQVNDLEQAPIAQEISLEDAPAIVPVQNAETSLDALEDAPVVESTQN